MFTFSKAQHLLTYKTEQPMYQVLGIILAVFFLAPTAEAQILKRKAESVKTKSVDRVENRSEQSIDRGLDKVEEGIGGLFKKKKKKEKNTETTEEPTSAPANTPNGNNNTNAATGNGNENAPASLRSYSKFDFVPGEKVIWTEDFSEAQIGDFPLEWNTNASGEIVTLSQIQGKFLKQDKGVFVPEAVKTLPEHFTLEFDMAVSSDFSRMMSGLKVFFVTKQKTPTLFDHMMSGETQVGFDIHPVGDASDGSCYFWVFNKNQEKVVENDIPVNLPVGEVQHISVWRQKSRIRVYANETKIIDLPRAFESGVPYELIFANYAFAGQLYSSNFRLAVGAPDTRNKLLTEGKLVTRGILFDVNSAQIKPVSAGTLKEIADVLKANPTLRVKIVGHTDSDGDAAANLALSARRAEAVKNALVQEYGVSAANLQTEGKGETEPSDSNNTPLGKANNRRVEFIKL